jgi:hypothetical protein
MELVSWSIYFGDTARDVTMRVLDTDRALDVRYRPVTDRAIDVPVFKAKSAAASDADCKAWLAG